MFLSRRLDRAVIARYFAFLVISQLVIFTLIGVGFSGLCTFVDEKTLTLSAVAVEQVVVEVGSHTSFDDIINNLHSNATRLQ